MPIFVLTDILFFPFLGFYTLPISLLIVIYYLIKNFKIKTTIKFDSFLISLLLITFLVNLILGLIDDLNSISKNLLFQLQIATGFLYYLYFSQNLKSVKQIAKVINIFFFSIFILMCIFLFNYDWYLIFKSLFYHSYDLKNIEKNRFGYFFENPNVFCYWIVSIFGFSLFLIKNNKYKIIISIITLIVAYLTQSRGGMLSFLIVLVYFFQANFINNLRITSRIFIIFIIIPLFFYLVYIYILYANDRFSIDQLIYAINQRMMIYDIFTSYNGYPKIFEIGVYKTGSLGAHSDLLYLTYSYGIFFIIIFFIFFFRDLFFFKKEFVFLIPIFIAFMIDSFTMDTKSILLASSFLGICRKIFNEKKL